MDNFWTALGYLIFGRRWILWNMKHGYKTALFVNEVEIDMQKARLVDAQNNIKNATAEVEAIEKSPLKEALSILPEEQHNDAKAIHEAEKRIKTERDETVLSLRNKIKTFDTETKMIDGELQRIFHLTYQNRLKFDFIKKYSFRPIYGDKNFK